MQYCCGEQATDYSIQAVTTIIDLLELSMIIWFRKPINDNICILKTMSSYVYYDICITLDVIGRVVELSRNSQEEGKQNRMCNTKYDIYDLPPPPPPPPISTHTHQKNKKNKWNK